MESEALYEKYKDNRHWDNHPTIYAERFLQFLRSRGFSGLLVDVGCGSGRDLEYFYNNGLRNVLGIDISEEETVTASKRSKARVMVDDVETSGILSQSVEAVFMINVIHYVDQLKAISEIHRILANGGYLFIHFNLMIIDDLGTIDYRQSEGEVLQLFKGFNIIQQCKFERIDEEPLRHRHLILELILQKF